MVHPSKLFGRLGNTLFQMSYIYAQMRKGAIPDIYVQNPAYFDYYKDDIKKWFGDGIERIDKVAIHLRQGDYVNNPFYVNLSESDYYQEAIKNFPNESFLVFSDDIEFAKKFFVGEVFTFSEGKSEVEDLNLMASCKHQIIANSSYSYWAAYLNPNKDKIVVAPSYKRWYTDGSTTRTIIPKEWKQI